MVYDGIKNRLPTYWVALAARYPIHDTDVTGNGRVRKGAPGRRMMRSHVDTERALDIPYPEEV